MPPYIMNKKIVAHPFELNVNMGRSFMIILLTIKVVYSYLVRLIDPRKLALIQMAVKALLCKQCLMIALFHDLAVAHDEDHVRGLDRGEAVRNDKGRPSFHQFCESVLDL